MYQFITGPLLWFSFAVFFIGCIYRVVKYIRGLAWQLDRVAYRKYPGPGAKGAIRSVVYWLIPFRTRSWRVKPVMALMFFVFHLGLVITPIFLLAHAILIQESWGLAWPSLPGGLADLMILGVLVAGGMILLRRLLLPEVRFMSTFQDFFVWAIAVAPFLTGFIAARQVEYYQFWLTVHILCGELMLVAIPFTKLSHFVLFFCSRAQVGMDFGIKRGGMKGTNMSW